MSLNLHETACGKDDPVTDYMKAKYSMTPDERGAAFRQLAGSFGQADAETLAYRQACRKAGASVVFRGGECSREDALRILQSPKVRRLMAE
jgi:hypothetical protein